MPAPFHIGDFARPATYVRGGRTVFLDGCRFVLVPATPEEEVRQKFVAYLERKLAVPRRCIVTEAHLNRFKPGSSGRADLIVSTEDGVPLAVVECKAPSIPLGDNTLQQVLAYHSVVSPKAQVVATTNGNETRWYRVRPDGSAQQLVDAPSFSALLRGTLPAVVAPKPRHPRPAPQGLTPGERQWFQSEGMLGAGSPERNHAHLANLMGLLHLEPSEPAYAGRHESFAIVDTGLRTTTFGNAAGGQWPGLYRYFVLQDAAGEAQVVSISILGKGFVENHPTFGNMNGHTILLVAIDDNEKSHNSLQLDLDKFVDVRKGVVTVWHDGTLTRGKRGRAKNADVVDFVTSQTPHLVTGGVVVLGTMPRDRLITWVDAEAFIHNCIEYALIRDRFRREVD